jgi:NADH dehydrogenase FAD-containing subunit
MEYDALLVAVGQSEVVRSIEGITEKDNLLFFRSIQDSLNL